MNTVEQQLLQFTLNQFPRDFGITPTENNESHRIPCYNFDHLKELYYKHLLHKNIYIGINPYSSMRSINKILNRVVFDFDAHDKPLEPAHQEMLTIYDYYKSVHNYSPLAIFSGRGFHLHVFLEPMEIKRYKESLKRYIQTVYELINLDLTDSTLDLSLLCNINGLIRLPYSYNYNCKDKLMYVIPISTNASIDQIIDHSINRTQLTDISIQYLKNDSMITMLDKTSINDNTIDSNIVVASSKDSIDRINKELDFISKCTSKIVDWRNFDGRHRILWLFIVPRLLALGMKEDEIHSWCSEWVLSTKKDYEEYRSYVVKWIARTVDGNWRGWSLKRFLMEFPDLANYLNTS